MGKDNLKNKILAKNFAHNYFFSVYNLPVDQNIAPAPPKHKLRLKSRIIELALVLKHFLICIRLI